MGKADNNESIASGMRIGWIIFLLILIYPAFGFIRDYLFVSREMSGWENALAIVEQSGITEGPTVKWHSGSKYSRGYHEYTVKYMYTARFEAWGGPFVFTYEGSNTGRLPSSSAPTPLKAYAVPKEGSELAVIYDPNARGSYRIGSKEEWQAKMGPLSKDDNLIILCVFGFMAGVFFMADISLRSSIAKKKTENNSETQAPPPVPQSSLQEPQPVPMSNPQVIESAKKRLPPTID